MTTPRVFGLQKPHNLRNMNLETIGAYGQLVWVVKNSDILASIANEVIMSAFRDVMLPIFDPERDYILTTPFDSHCAYLLGRAVQSTWPNQMISFLRWDRRIDEQGRRIRDWNGQFEGYYSVVKL